MSAPGYGRYKDSGVDWLGEVPAHWKVMPCRAIVAERFAKNEAAACEDYLSVMANVGVIPYAEKGDVGNKAPEDLSKCKLVAAGDIVINSMNYGIGSFGLSHLDGVCSPVYIVLRPISSVVQTRFAFRLFANRAFQTYAQSYGNGILAHRAAIGWNSLKAIPVPVPPIDEQLAILTFLDHETAKIDALIDEQKRLIELLKEKRQAAISHAVTKGLNPSVSMKDIGVEWLGAFPAHWKVKALKRAIARDTSISYGIVQPGDPLEDGVPFVQTTNMTTGDFDRGSLQRTSPEIAASYPRSTLSGGEVILGIRASIGACHVVPQHLAGCNLSRGVARIVCGNDLLSDFLVWYLSTSEVARYWLLARQGSTFNEVSIETVRELLVLVPPIEEQVLLSNAVNALHTRLGTLVAEAEAAMELLRERRSALISAAVTGKIDVRGLVPQPEAVEA